MAYVGSAVVGLQTHDSIMFEARGNAMNAAIYAAHMLLRQIKDIYKIEGVSIHEEEIEQDGQKRNISGISITHLKTNHLVKFSRSS